MWSVRRTDASQRRPRFSALSPASHSRFCVSTSLPVDMTLSQPTSTFNFMLPIFPISERPLSDLPASLGKWTVAVTAEGYSTRRQIRVQWAGIPSLEVVVSVTCRTEQTAPRYDSDVAIPVKAPEGHLQLSLEPPYRVEPHLMMLHLRFHVLQTPPASAATLSALTSSFTGEFRRLHLRTSTKTITSQPLCNSDIPTTSAWSSLTHQIAISGAARRSSGRSRPTSPTCWPRISLKDRRWWLLLMRGPTRSKKSRYSTIPTTRGRRPLRRISHRRDGQPRAAVTAFTRW